MTSVRIADRSIGGIAPAFIIAEAGFNHGGNLQAALDQIDAAAFAGADAIKFQSFRASDLVLPDSPIHPIIADCFLDEEAHARLAARCAEKNILFSSTPFSTHWVRVLEELHVPFFKVASMDLTNPELLGAIGRTHKPVVLSTGMATLEECRYGLDELHKAGAREIVLLHCVSLYPTPLEKTNLRVLRTLADAFHLPVGFSDHTLGSEAAAIAVAAGASVIEKHFTLDQNLPGPDHKLSVDPAGLAGLVKSVRSVESMLGTGVKLPDEEERKITAATRRGVALTRGLEAGHILTEADIFLIRPGSGIPAESRGKVLGRRLLQSLPKDHLLQWTDLALSD